MKIGQQNLQWKKIWWENVASSLTGFDSKVWTLHSTIQFDSRVSINPCWKRFWQQSVNPSQRGKKQTWKCQSTLAERDFFSSKVWTFTERGKKKETNLQMSINLWPKEIFTAKCEPFTEKKKQTNKQTWKCQSTLHWKRNMTMCQLHFGRKLDKEVSALICCSFDRDRDMFKLSQWQVKVIQYHWCCFCALTL